MNLDLNKTAENLYISFYCAKGYEDQEPSAKYAKWYDLLWFLFPIVGILLFVIAIDERYKKEKNNG